MRQLSQVAGAKVMSRSSAERVGRVERLVLDIATRRVVAVQVGRDRLVDWTAVTGMGDAAVVVDDEERVRPPADDRERRALAGDLDIVRKRVLSDAGNELGTVADVELDESSGAIEAVVTTEGRIPAELLGALGSYCLVVGREAEAAVAG